jgi:hypothetical protein
LPTGATALLYSDRAAERFAELVDDAGRARPDFSVLAISRAVALAAGSGWRHSAHAAEATEASVLSGLQKSLRSGAADHGQDNA